MSLRCQQQLVWQEPQGGFVSPGPGDGESECIQATANKVGSQLHSSPGMEPFVKIFMLAPVRMAEAAATPTPANSKQTHSNRTERELALQTTKKLKKHRKLWRRNRASSSRRVDVL